MKNKKSINTRKKEWFGKIWQRIRCYRTNKL